MTVVYCLTRGVSIEGRVSIRAGQEECPRLAEEKEASLPIISSFVELRIYHGIQKVTPTP